LLRILFGLLFAGAALWCARTAVLAWRRREDWKRGGIVVSGEVVGFEERNSNDASDRRPLFAPIVTFKTAEGRPGRFTSSQAVRPNPYTIGQSLPVRYIASNPSDADLDSVSGSLLTFGALVTFAIVFLAVALLPIFLPMPVRR
ncbi:MAG TPA: DUF3592 domain-containing protein, partial [Thermoanaerobaculia bacterium]